ncbi:uncharacterized protein EV420DRAFT_1497938 [Desarmillaria tabescens]|uniref:BHLH domain-containing protein n=1 Tax=Armillaria tabescens TaxID=1929756 RepID=A0AA39NQK9_ARMTA|nr:uncharacterized protein EV420DRAFT_1497938 [Desarmillaria tabescens]KAK0470011.1 hypothetical protein EV420DRAFT_1497938 [Desarmillaria tabescens]
MPQAAAQHDPALAGQPAAPSNAVPTTTPDLSSLGLGREQILSLLSNLPVFKVTDQGPKADAAQILSNLAQQQGFVGVIPGFPGPGISDPGPSSHPRGPPNLGQQKETEEGSDEGEGAAKPPPKPENAPPINQGPNPNLGGRRSKSGATMGSDEWTRQRKDNHKEVERRRRGNINEGINELGRIVPNGSGEKAKGAILSRAVQYIHHLKENEARNIEKWTLEKLLMDQAMGDLQAQLEDMRKMWEEERANRQRIEAEIETIRSGAHAGQKRPREDEDGKDGDGKKQRTE